MKLITETNLELFRLLNSYGPFFGNGVDMAPLEGLILEWAVPTRCRPEGVEIEIGVNALTLVGNTAILVYWEEDEDLEKNCPLPLYFVGNLV